MLVHIVLGLVLCVTKVILKINLNLRGLSFSQATSDSAQYFLAWRSEESMESAVDRKCEAQPGNGEKQIPTDSYAVVARQRS